MLLPDLSRRRKGIGGLTYMNPDRAGLMDFWFRPGVLPNAQLHK
jgi:hypothetical protein